MFDATRGRVQPIHALPRARVDAARIILHQTLDQVAREASRRVIGPHPESLAAGVLHQHEAAVVGADPQSPGAVGKQGVDRASRRAIALFEAPELPAVVAKQGATAPRAHPNAAVAVLGEGAY